MINARDLYRVDHPSPDERLVIQLAMAMHQSRCPGDRVVSWRAQCDAAQYFNAFGSEATLAFLIQNGS